MVAGSWEGRFFASGVPPVTVRPGSTFG